MYKIAVADFHSVPMHRKKITSLVYSLMGKQDKFHNVSQGRTLRTKMEV